MKKIIVFLFLCLMSVAAWSQSVTDGSFRTIGFIKSDGTMQDSSFRTIGHAKGIPMKWAAFFFFFRK